MTVTVNAELEHVAGCAPLAVAFWITPIIHCLDEVGTKRNCCISRERVPECVRTFEMMKKILKAGPNQMETLRRLRTDAAAIDKDVTIRSERIRQTRDFRIRFWFREKAMEQRFAASPNSESDKTS